MIAARTTSTRETITDRVAQTRVMQVWNVPQYDSADVERLQLLAQVLGGSRASRLDKRLFFGDKLVDRISASMDASELGGTFDITADIKEGVDPALVEKAINEELDRLLKDGPTEAELEQARMVFVAGFVRGVERIGGFGGKADALAECTVYTGNPGCFRDQMTRIQTSTADQVKPAGNQWLRAGDYTLTVKPGEVTPIVEEPSAPAGKTAAIPKADPKYTTIPSDLDRSKGVPITTQFPDLKFPALQRGQLSNGTKVILAERHDVPVVQMSMEFPGGFASDQGIKKGTASFTMGMLDEGAGEYDAIGLGNRMEFLGANIGSSASLDSAEVTLSALTQKLDDSLRLYADVIRSPRFEDKEIERVRATWLATIQQEKSNPGGMIQRTRRAPGLRRGSSLCDSVQRHRICGRYRQPQPRRNARLASPAHAARHRDADDRRRHHAGRDHADARKALRQLEGLRRQGAADHDSDRGPGRFAARVPDRPARRDPDQYRRRPAGSAVDRMQNRSTSTSPTSCWAAR